MITDSNIKNKINSYCKNYVDEKLFKCIIKKNIKLIDINT